MQQPIITLRWFAIRKELKLATVNREIAAVDAKKMQQNAVGWLKSKVVLHVSFSCSRNIIRKIFASEIILVTFSLIRALIKSRSCAQQKIKCIMSTDLEYNYEEALQRQKFSDSDVNELREKIKKFENVPKTLSARKVKQNLL